jgi:hypothetical protein
MRGKSREPGIDLLAAGAAWLLTAGRAPAAAAPGFARKPTVTLVGAPAAGAGEGKVKIDFAVDRATDVAVYVESAGGKVVRHLVAGLLGANAPLPLRAGTLAQSLEWDGRDDDGRQVFGGPPGAAQPADAGGFRVRVALGLRASYAGEAFAEVNGPNRLLNVMGLAVAPDGRLYVLDELHGFAHTGGTTVHVYRRDGSYEKTIKPFPAHLPPERLKAAGAYRNGAGQLTPLIHLPSEHMAFYPAVDVKGQQMAFTAEQHLLLAVYPVGDGRNVSSEAHLAAIDADGGTPHAAYTGPALGAKLAWSGPHLAAGSDGKSLFVSGLGTRSGESTRSAQQVFRVPLTERGPATAIFGERDSAGGDAKRLNGPAGLAVDGRGHLLVADHGNDRVVVLKEEDGSFVGSFAVPSPGWLAAAPKSGAIYVRSGAKVLKFAAPAGAGAADWKGLKEVAGVALPTPAGAKYYFALDASSEPAVLWVGLTCRRGLGKAGGLLLRSEDLGAEFGDLTPIEGSRPAARFTSLSVDPLRQEVGCMKPNGGLVVLNEASGQVRHVKVEPLKGLRPTLGMSSAGFQLGRDGKVFMIAFSVPVSQYDSTTGKAIPFTAPAAQACGGGLPDTRGDGPGRGKHGLAVDRRGCIYVKHYDPERKVREVKVFSPEGAYLRTAIHRIVDRGMLGPRVDPQGNIYIADAIRPAGRAVPDDLDLVFAGIEKRWQPHIRGWYGDFLYGSVVKFGPAGGAIWRAARAGNEWVRGAPPPGFKGDPSWRSEPVESWGRPALLQGAQWWRFGYSPQEGKGGRYVACHCTYTDFDVDDFGRVFHPDQARFQAAVLDTNGNEILRFGGYGNQDHRGPESYVLDPLEKCYRPRGADDPKELASPFAQPEIALAWMVGLAVTERNLYVADGMSRRVLRVRLDYAASETCAVPR